MILRSSKSFRLRQSFRNSELSNFKPQKANEALSPKHILRQNKKFVSKTKKYLSRVHCWER